MKNWPYGDEGPIVPARNGIWVNHYYWREKMMEDRMLKKWLTWIKGEGGLWILLLLWAVGMAVWIIEAVGRFG